MSLVRVQLPEPRIRPQNRLILRCFFDLTLSDLGIFRHTAIHPEIYIFLHSSYTERTWRPSLPGRPAQNKPLAKGVLLSTNATTPKGLPMKYTHFDDITPNNRTEFAMLYFAAIRTMRKLEAAIRKTNNGHLTGRQAGLLLHLQRKFAQMSAAWKSQQNKYKE